MKAAAISNSTAKNLYKRSKARRSKRSKKLRNRVSVQAIQLHQQLVTKRASANYGSAERSNRRRSSLIGLYQATNHDPSQIDGVSPLTPVIKLTRKSFISPVAPEPRQQDENKMPAASILFRYVILYPHSPLRRHSTTTTTTT